MNINGNALRVSIVIPVYNEADHLGACLQAIAEQTVKPYEVIVVDNNSDDESRTVAAAFPFVKLIKEKRQGVVYARNRGFNAASGEIIGRIDADTIVDLDWIVTLQRIFTNPDIDAVSGSVGYYDVTSPRLSGYIDLFFRQRLARQLDKEVFLYGANMGLRRSCWLSIRDSLCSQAGLHEDFDLAIHAEQNAATVVFEKQLRAAVSLRRFSGSFKDFWQYARLSPLTYAQHGRTSQYHMYGVIAMVSAFYWFIRLNHQLYDTHHQRIILGRLIVPSSLNIRVNPATFVE